MPVSNQNAPFTKSPEFSRDSFLKTPDWRWQEAKRLSMDINGYSATISQLQPLIGYAARMINACQDTSSRQFVRIKLPDFWQVMTLGEMDGSSKMKAAVQACIIYGLNPQEISDKLKWITKLQAKLYIDLFCDISGVQGIAQWFQHMLLQPARHYKNMNLFKARALAHYHSLQAALHSLRFGNSGVSAKQAMASMWRDARDTQLFQYMAKNLNVPVQIYVPSMQQAIKARQQHIFITETKQGNSQSSALLAAAQSLDNSVRSFTQAQINNPQGADPSAQYIQIINKKNQQKA